MLRLIGVGDNVVDCNYTTGIMYPGGNSLNFSVYGRQLGHETAYAGVLGTDIQADMVVHALEDKGVDISRCVRVQGETGICGIRLKDGDRTITDENDAGVVKSHPLQITEELLEYIKTFDVVHSSCFSHIEDQLVKIRETGVPLLYDFSDVWEEKDLAAVCPDITIAFFSGKDLGEEKLKELLHRRYNVKVRMPMLKGINDSREEIDQVIRFLMPFRDYKNFKGIDLLPYHKMGVNKYNQLDRPYPIDGDPSLSDGDLSRIEGWLKEYQFPVTVVRH